MQTLIVSSVMASSARYGWNYCLCQDDNPWMALNFKYYLERNVIRVKFLSANTRNFPQGDRVRKPNILYCSQ